MSFVHLHLHTEYSLVDSVIRIASEFDAAGQRTVRGVMDAVVDARMPAVALTDQSNLFAMVKFYKAALGKGIKPLVGVDVFVYEVGERIEPTRLVLLCQNDEGYKNLTRLVSRSYQEGQRKGIPHIERSWLTPGTVSGLIALSAGISGDIGRAIVGKRTDDARTALEYWLALFGDRFYLELQRTGRPHEEAYIGAALQLAVTCGVPVVATNDVRFIARTDYESHEARVCIHEGSQLADPSRQRRYSEQQYLRSPAEMLALFDDIPEACANTIEIAKRCNLQLQLGKSVLPQYPVPDGTTIDEFLRNEAARGLVDRIVEVKAHPPFGARVVSEEEYRARLQTELDVIVQMGFAGYFLIVADFIRWSRENGIPVGPGRGSGAGSLVAYSLGITDLDPLPYDLLFERFLNPERVSMPDFDVDFCMDGRDRVIDYVAQKYGRERVSQIITYGTMAAKAVVRDVARVMGQSYGFADSIAKLIPFELGITLKDALEKEEELKRRYEKEDDTRELIDMALSLEGLVRNAGMHAGGVVIAPSRLTDFAPLYCDEQGTSLVTQFDKDDVEAAGLVKFDFLGLRTLTIIDWAIKIINAERATKNEPPLDLKTIPLNDKPTYTLLQRGDTTAVFQLESRGMKDLIRRLQPDCFEDIVALVALFRPGPLQSGMVDDFIARKKADKNTPIDYLHPDLKPVLAPTYGVILYQEQVMQIPQVLAGYTLGGADLLRRAMGKKNADEMAKQRSVFVDGSTQRGVPQEQAAYIFDLMEKFAGYGFNKSHSAAYALLSYQTAWLKTHYGASFMSAVLSSDMDKTDKVVGFIEDARRMQLKVEPPDVNTSSYMFTVSGPRSIRYGLGAVKGVGQAAVENIMQERLERGPFKSLEDFCRRIDANKINKRVVEALIRSGSCDGIGHNRATLMHSMPRALQLADQNTKALAAGQDDLFGLVAAPVQASVETPTEPVEMQPEWSESIRLTGERETLGLYLTGHPIAQYEREIQAITSGRIADVAGAKPVNHGEEGGFRFKGKPVTIAGLILDVRKRGNRTTLMLDDRSARLEVSMFEETFQQYRTLIAKDAIVIIEGNLRFDDFIEDWRLNAKRIVDIEQAREKLARRLNIRWPESATNGAGKAFITNLQSVLKDHKNGQCNVAVYYRGESARAALTLSDEWAVRPTKDLLEKLERLVGRDGVKLDYGPRVDA
ncbi:MAG TPA: DNA polymerase III subunit alpha [Steroidobacteraceae bacterium]|nr:DNA polymerase III subunit alpha [Steroidobacteraceae bacterium]